MQKIKTIFERNWEGNKKVIDCYSDETISEILKVSTATEKLDGTNIRLTVRNHTLVRVEKRCNPSSVQKNKGIIDPWYVDAEEGTSQDKYIWEAAKNTDLTTIEDGEWSGEAIGPKIQGNPLKLTAHTCCLFSCNKAPILENCPITFEDLKIYLHTAQSKFGTGLIEGIVWHSPNGEMFKIKGKDF